MNCKKHPSRETVATCENCGAGVCYECASATEYARRDYGTLCPDCLADLNYKVALNKLNENSKLRARSIAVAILYIIGVVVAVIGLLQATSAEGSNDRIVGILMVIGGLVCCGFYVGLTSTLGDMAKETRRHGGYDGSAGAWYMRIVMFVFYCAFGVLLTPIRFVKMLKTIKQNKEDVKWHKEEIAKLRSM